MTKQKIYLLSILTIFLVLLLTMVGYFGYQYFVVNPQKALNAQALQKASEELQKTFAKNDLRACLSNASLDKQALWDSNCKVVGKTTNCSSLPMTLVDYVDQQYQSEQDMCFKQYPQN